MMRVAAVKYFTESKLIVTSAHLAMYLTMWINGCVPKKKKKS